MKVLVYGWYHQKNLGDDLFIDAFKHLFPTLDLTFTEEIVESDLNDIDAVFFGGGSFLFDAPRITNEAMRIIKAKPIFYIGIGVEHKIHPIHMELMALAKMIATRSADQLARLQQINNNVRVIPDLVYSLRPKAWKSTKTGASVLILPNISVLPQQCDAHWKHAAWSYFKSEFCQFMDWIVESGYNLSLYPMCNANELDDAWAAAELIAHMNRRKSSMMLLPDAIGIGGITALVSQFDVVITQRFHGIVLSEITDTPYIAIHHHDKLRKNESSKGIFLSYYGSSKHSFISAFEQAIKMKPSSSLIDESAIFIAFSKEVVDLL